MTGQYVLILNTFPSLRFQNPRYKGDSRVSLFLLNICIRLPVPASVSHYAVEGVVSTDLPID